MKVLAVDPGYDRIGIAIIEKIPMTQREVVLFSECFKTDKTQSLNERIFWVGQEIERVIHLYGPTILAIENLFLQTNQKTVIGVAEAKGVIKYIARKNNLEVFEYTPLQIKAAITGQGKATKDQIMFMVPKLVVLEDRPFIDDEMDAIAIGITCFAYQRFV